MIAGITASVANGAKALVNVADAAFELILQELTFGEAAFVALTMAFYQAKFQDQPDGGAMELVTVLPGQGIYAPYATVQVFANLDAVPIYANGEYIELQARYPGETDWVRVDRLTDGRVTDVMIADNHYRTLDASGEIGPSSGLDGDSVIYYRLLHVNATGDLLGASLPTSWTILSSGGV